MPRCPLPTEAEAIAQDAEPSVRNLRITLAYHELSAALAVTLTGAAERCTFATWASRQAGQTIRSRQETASISDPPFTPEQAAATGRGRRPAGRL